MSPTLKDNDLVLMYKSHNVKTGDIVAVGSDAMTKLLCKRVIGVAGDSVCITDGIVYLNGTMLDEPYVNKELYTLTHNLMIVPEGYVFVLGDNRCHSTDSRELGLLKINDIVGIMLFNLTDLIGVNYITIDSVAVVGILCCIILFIVCAVYDILRRKNFEEKDDNNYGRDS